MAQEILRELFEKAAAVIVPALRPSHFLMSAMSDLIFFEYSLSSGNCQNFSPTSFPRRLFHYEFLSGSQNRRMTSPRQSKQLRQRGHVDNFSSTHFFA